MSTNCKIEREKSHNLKEEKEDHGLIAKQNKVWHELKQVMSRYPISIINTL